ncbi:ankyrin repeat domain-containing protein 49-like [Ischnura elegans]|uniref:ankyrin repeat domain-containing protein 49-like n=1 Tax=Ischnura elegans TaxID=197161 RepID=UPI001ED86E64|nr:ankyrin repeat domain-containing protein 49-like [Ischnura elegans]
MSDEEENDSFPNEGARIPEESSNLSGMYVSGWDDDTVGIDEEPNPHENAKKEILWASEHGNLDLVKKLIQLEGSSLLKERDKDGYTPLHRACYNGHEDVVEYLLEKGADLKATTKDGWQPLHSACNWNFTHCASLLLDHGADVNAVTNGGLTPLHLASSSSNARDTLILLLLNPNLDPSILNNSGETASQVARRSGPNHSLFECADPCITMI